MNTLTRLQGNAKYRTTIWDYNVAVLKIECDSEPLGSFFGTLNEFLRGVLKTVSVMRLGK